MASPPCSSSPSSMPASHQKSTASTLPFSKIRTLNMHSLEGASSPFSSVSTRGRSEAKGMGWEMGVVVGKGR